MKRTKKWAVYALALLIFLGTLPTQVFSLSEKHWADEAITHCLEKGYFSQSMAETPDAAISRGSFAIVLQNVFHYPLSNHSFQDIPDDADYAESVGALFSAGIVKGISDTAFAPAETLTRQEAATFLSRAYALIPKPGNKISRFTDDASVSDWAQEAVAALNDAGYIKGYPDGSFGPQNRLTFAHIAQILYNIEKSGLSVDDAETPLAELPGSKTNGGGSRTGGSAGDGSSGQPSGVPANAIISLDSTGIITLSDGSSHGVIALNGEAAPYGEYTFSLAGNPISALDRLNASGTLLRFALPDGEEGRTLEIAKGNTVVSIVIMNEYGNSRFSAVSKSTQLTFPAPDLRLGFGKLKVSEAAYAAQYFSFTKKYPNPYYSVETQTPMMMLDAVSGATSISPSDPEHSSNGNVEIYVAVDPTLLINACCLDEMGIAPSDAMAFLHRYKELEPVPYSPTAAYPGAARYLLEDGSLGATVVLNAKLIKQAPPLTMESASRLMGTITMRYPDNALTTKWFANVTSLYLNGKRLNRVSGDSGDPGYYFDFTGGQSGTLKVRAYGEVKSEKNQVVVLANGYTDAICIQGLIPEMPEALPAPQLVPTEAPVKGRSISFALSEDNAEWRSGVAYGILSNDQWAYDVYMIKLDGSQDGIVLAPYENLHPFGYTGDYTLRIGVEGYDDAVIPFRICEAAPSFTQSWDSNKLVLKNDHYIYNSYLDSIKLNGTLLVKGMDYTVSQMYTITLNPNNFAPGQPYALTLSARAAGYFPEVTLNGTVPEDHVVPNPPVQLQKTKAVLTAEPYYLITSGSSYVNVNIVVSVDDPTWRTSIKKITYGSATSSYPSDVTKSTTISENAVLINQLYGSSGYVVKIQATGYEDVVIPIQVKKRTDNIGLSCEWLDDDSLKISTSDFYFVQDNREIWLNGTLLSADSYTKNSSKRNIVIKPSAFTAGQEISLRLVSSESSSWLEHSFTFTVPADHSYQAPPPREDSGVVLAAVSTKKGGDLFIPLNEPYAAWKAGITKATLTGIYTEDVTSRLLAEESGLRIPYFQTLNYTGAYILTIEAEGYLPVTATIRVVNPAPVLSYVWGSDYGDLTVTTDNYIYFQTVSKMYLNGVELTPGEDFTPYNPKDWYNVRLSADLFVEDIPYTLLVVSGEAGYYEDCTLVITR